MSRFWSCHLADQKSLRGLAPRHPPGVRDPIRSLRAPDSSRSSNGGAARPRPSGFPSKPGICVEAREFEGQYLVLDGNSMDMSGSGVPQTNAWKEQYYYMIQYHTISYNIIQSRSFQQWHHPLSQGCNLAVKVIVVLLCLQDHAQHPKACKVGPICVAEQNGLHLPVVCCHLHMGVPTCCQIGR